MKVCNGGQNLERGVDVILEKMVLKWKPKRSTNRRKMKWLLIRMKDKKTLIASLSIWMSLHFILHYHL